MSWAPTRPGRGTGRASRRQPVSVSGSRVVTGLAGAGGVSASLRLRDAARLKRYGEYQRFYDGQHFERPRNGRTNLVLNYARAVVDKGVAYLLGRGIGWSVAPVRTELERAQRRASEVEQLLYGVGQDNDVDAVDLAVAQNAAVLGDGVYKVLWDVEERRVRILSVDPRTFFATFAGDDPTRLRRVECSYQLGMEDLAAGGYGVGEAEVAALAGSNDPFGSQARSGQALVDVVERWTAETLEVIVAGTVTRSDANPYGFIPFVHVANLPPANEAWGRSDLVDVIPINRELDERVSDESDVIRFHADPPIVFKGVDDRSDVSVGPGSVWDIPPDADVKLLEWTGQGIQVGQQLDRLLRSLFEVSETPRTAFGDSDGLLTGVALEIQLRPLVQKTLRRRVTWTRALRQRAVMALRLLEQFGGAVPGSVTDYRVQVIWPPMLPKDDAVEVSNQVSLVTAGLRSHRTAMDALGTESPEEELARVVEDRETLGESPAAQPPSSGVEDEIPGQSGMSS